MNQHTFEVPAPPEPDQPNPNPPGEPEIPPQEALTGLAGC